MQREEGEQPLATGRQVERLRAVEQLEATEEGDPHRCPPLDNRRIGIQRAHCRRNQGDLTVALYCAAATFALAVFVPCRSAVALAS